MPIVAKATESTYVLCPAGMDQGVCVDVIDQGLQDGPYGPKHKVIIRWQLSETQPDGEPFQVQRQYTKSLHEKAALRHDLESWRGKPFTDAELSEGFDLEKLIGVNCQILVIHRKTDDGKTWANVQTVAPNGKGMAKLAAKNYVREKDRKTKPGDEHPLSDNDDDIPF